MDKKKSLKKMVILTVVFIPVVLLKVIKTQFARRDI